MALHYDPKYYPDPERFDPERFSEDEKKKRPKFSYLPFGEGPRICIGEPYLCSVTHIR
jgi:cytochrome P450 family 6